MPAGLEQFRRAITSFRNTYIIAGLAPLMVFRTEIIANDEFMDRGGTDDATQLHFKNLLLHCDRWRRRVTHNPEKKDLGTLIEEAIDPNGKADVGKTPFGGDNIQNASGGLIDLPWRLDGTDVDIPLNSQLKFKNGSGLIILGAVDRAIVNWTRLNSRDSTKFITATDSLRVYGDYQAILGYIEAFMGTANRVDVAQVLPSDEPLGPTDSANRITETVNAKPLGTAK
jgi:hypothetical protein